MRAVSTDDDRLLTVDDVAQMLAVPKSWVRGISG